MDGALEEASEVLKPEAGSVEFSQPFIHATNIYVAPPVYIPIYSTSPLPPFIPTPHCEMDVNIPIFRQGNRGSERSSHLPKVSQPTKGRAGIQTQEATLTPKPML